MDSDLVSAPNASHVFMHLLMRSNFAKRKSSARYQCVELSPGDVLIGTEELAEKAGMSRQSIRTALEYLKNTERITIKSTNRYSIVSIVNWDTYQGSEDNSNQQINQHVTSSQPARNHTIRSKEVKKDQNPAAVALYEFYAENIINEPAKRSDAIRNITKLLNKGHTKEDLAGAVEDYLEKGIGEKPFHPNNFFGQKEYYKGFGKYAK